VERYRVGDRIGGISLGSLVTVFAFFGLAILALADRGEGDTAKGRAAATRWLGLQAYLRGDESFALLPPTAVAVWDRYLSYGDALDATPVCSALIDLGAGNRKRPWSSFGGTWHRMRVRYPGLWGWYGSADGVIRRSLMRGGAATFGLPLAGFFLGVLVLLLHGQVVSRVPPAYFAWADQGTAVVGVGLMAVSVFGQGLRLPRLWGRYGQTALRLAAWSLVQMSVGLLVLASSRALASTAPRRDMIEAAALALALGLILRAGYRLVRTIVDLAAPVTFDGEVLGTRVWRSSSRGMDRARRAWLYYLSVDSGSGHRTTAWALPSELQPACANGDLVRLTARPWSRRVTALSVLAPPAMAGSPDDPQFGHVIIELMYLLQFEKRLMDHVDVMADAILHRRGVSFTADEALAELHDLGNSTLHTATLIRQRHSDPELREFFGALEARLRDAISQMGSGPPAEADQFK
jgi:hypothetical protein